VIRRAIACSLALSCTGEAPSPPVARASSASAAISASAASSAASAETPGLAALTPNTFLARGTPTFVVGTLGSERARRQLRGQVELLRSTLFPAAPIVDDTSIDTKRGAAGWPPNPVLYGGPQQNAALAGLEAELPFTMQTELLSIGSIRLEGPGARLITVVPAREGSSADAGYPAFLLYAGTGEAGVAEINGVPHGKDAILIADVFGPLTTGMWLLDDSTPKASLAQQGERPTVIAIEDEVPGATAKATVELNVLSGASFAEALPYREALLRGLSTSLKKLAVQEPTHVAVYLYPDAATKQRLTQNGGNGHAVPSSQALHVVMFDPKVGGPLERLTAHEATHVYASQLWGPPGTALLGEGLAVWVSGQYGGSTLREWKSKLPKRAPIESLLGRRFLQLPEGESYPHAGLFVAAAVDEIGLDKVRAHLYGATPDGWSKACAAAGLVKGLAD